MSTHLPLLVMGLGGMIVGILAEEGHEGAALLLGISLIVLGTGAIMAGEW